MRKSYLGLAVVGGLAILLTVVGTSPVQAVPSLPASFFGTVTDSSNGQPAPIGLLVVAQIAGRTFGLTSTFNHEGSTVYTLDVMGDDPETAAKEGGSPGEQLIIVIGSPDVGETRHSTTWQGGSNRSMNLTWAPKQAPSDGGGGDEGDSGGDGGGDEGGGSSGGGPVPTPVELNQLSSSTELTVDSNGIVQNRVTLTTEDGLVSLEIATGSTILDADGNALSAITASEVTGLPEAPEDSVIILSYDFGPDGASFDPAITLTINYDPEILPEGAMEEGLYIAFWDGSAWLSLVTTVDTETNMVSAVVSHFTPFVVISQMPAPEPVPAPEPAPAPEPTLEIEPAPAPELVPALVLPPPEPALPVRASWTLILGLLFAIVVVVLSLFVWSQLNRR